jgi:hypothetical protein
LLSFKSDIQHPSEVLNSIHFCDCPSTRSRFQKANETEATVQFPSSVIFRQIYVFNRFSERVFEHVLNIAGGCIERKVLDANGEKPSAIAPEFVLLFPKAHLCRGRILPRLHNRRLTVNVDVGDGVRLLRRRVVLGAFVRERDHGHSFFLVFRVVFVRFFFSTMSLQRERKKHVPGGGPSFLPGLQMSKKKVFRFRVFVRLQKSFCKHLQRRWSECPSIIW